MYTGSARLKERCPSIWDYNFKTKVRIEYDSLGKKKLQRANGGCLGYHQRRRTR